MPVAAIRSPLATGIAGLDTILRGGLFRTGL